MPEVRFDIPGVQVGVAEYEHGPTGCTVLLFAGGAPNAADVRGGAVGIVGDYGYAQAICLAGGSLLGLEAAAGVAAELWDRAGKPTSFSGIPLVAGGIVFDFHRGRNAVYPDKDLGRAAVAAGRADAVPVGTVGAGRSTNVGQGAAFLGDGDLRVLVVTVVNASGAIVDRTGSVVFGGNRPQGRPRTIAEELDRRRSAARPAPGNTTLTVVVTNASVGDRRQLARQVHTSMARAIQPFHTPDDGDVLWAVTTGTGPRMDPTALGIVASELAWDAVLCAAG